jgi:hypothetical protein
MVTVWTVHLHVRDFATRTPLHFLGDFATRTPLHFLGDFVTRTPLHFSERFCHTDTSTLLREILQTRCAFLSLRRQFRSENSSW